MNKYETDIIEAENEYSDPSSSVRVKSLPKRGEGYGGRPVPLPVISPVDEEGNSIIQNGQEE